MAQKAQSVRTPLPSGKMYSGDGSPYAGWTAERLRESIAQISKILIGPCGKERSALLADRADLRTALAALESP